MKNTITALFITCCSIFTASAMDEFDPLDTFHQDFPFLTLENIQHALGQHGEDFQSAFDSLSVLNDRAQKLICEENDFGLMALKVQLTPTEGQDLYPNKLLGFSDKIQMLEKAHQMKQVFAHFMLMDYPSKSLQTFFQSNLKYLTFPPLYKVFIDSMPTRCVISDLLEQLIYTFEVNIPSQVQEMNDLEHLLHSNIEDQKYYKLTGRSDQANIDVQTNLSDQIEEISVQIENDKKVICMVRRILADLPTTSM